MGMEFEGLGGRSMTEKERRETFKGIVSDVFKAECLADAKEALGKAIEEMKPSQAKDKVVAAYKKLDTII